MSVSGSALNYLNNNSITKYPFVDHVSLTSSVGTGSLVVPDSWFLDAQLGFTINYTGNPTNRRVYLSNLVINNTIPTATFSDYFTNVALITISLPLSSYTTYFPYIINNIGTTGIYLKFIAGIDFINFCLASVSNTNYIFANTDAELDASTIITYNNMITKVSVDGGATFIPAAGLTFAAGSNISITNPATNQIALGAIPGAGTGLYNNCANGAGLLTINKLNTGTNLTINHGECYQISQLTYSNVVNVLDVTDKTTAFNTVSYITVTNGGTGYSSPPTVTITGTGTGAVAQAVLTGNTVTSIIIISGGIGYTAIPTVTMSGGATATAVITTTPISQLVYQVSDGNFYICNNGDGSLSSDWYNLGIDISGLNILNLCGPACPEDFLTSYIDYIYRVNNASVQLGENINAIQNTLLDSFDILCTTSSPYLKQLNQVVNSTALLQFAVTSYADLRAIPTTCLQIGSPQALYDSSGSTITYYLATTGMPTENLPTIVVPTDNAASDIYWLSSGVQHLNSSQTFLTVAVTIYNTFENSAPFVITVTSYCGTLSPVTVIIDLSTSTFNATNISAGGTCSQTWQSTGTLTIPCNDVGIFKFIAEVNSLATDPSVCPSGPNVVVSVTTAGTNIIGSPFTLTF